MDKAEQTIERTMAFVSALRAQRERNLERRHAWQRRVEIQQPVVATKKGGIQLTLWLDGADRNDASGSPRD
jgi:hypothetical protein